LFIGDKKICIFRKNKIVSLSFLHQIFNFLSMFPPKKAHLPRVLEKTGVSCYIPLRGKQKYQVTKMAQRAKLSRLLKVLLNLK